MKKILVGCPTSDSHEYCLKEYVKSVKTLSYQHFDVLIVDNSKDNSYLNKIKNAGLPVIKSHWYKGARDRIVNSRNVLRQKVLDEGYDYLFSLEQDVIPPKDVIERLLKHDKKITTGVYFRRAYFNSINSKLIRGERVLTPLIWDVYNKEKNLMRYVSADFIMSFNGLMKVCACGLGCLLIHRSILEKIKFRYDKNDKGFDDVCFCMDARDQAFEIYADASIKCKHLLKNRPWKWADLKL